MINFQNTVVISLQPGGIGLNGRRFTGDFALANILSMTDFLPSLSLY